MRHFWKFIHNALVHPLMAWPWEPGLVRTFHDWTALKMAQPNLVVDDLLTRRGEQDAQWGGAQHDDTHDEEDWQRFINKQTQDAAGENHVTEWRDRMVDIGALAIAAIEWADRREVR